MTTQRGPLHELIVDGRKRQTIRKERKTPFKVGDPLTLYWKQRTKKADKEGEPHLIGKSYVVDVQRLRLKDFIQDRDVAHADGFVTLGEFERFFKKKPVDMDEWYQIIKWRYPLGEEPPKPETPLEVVVSDAIEPDEALVVAPDAVNEEGDVDPGKVVKVKNLGPKRDDAEVIV